MSTEMEAKYRLVTRADFDGLVCAALLKELDLIDDIVFVHPKDVADREVDITDRDITTNLPYDPRCCLAFDHHASEAIKLAGKIPVNLVLDPEADSAARVVYRYYGGRDRFPEISPDMMMAVDKADAARFTKEEVLQPSGWVLLNFIMDPRTGLGRFSQFRISNFALMRDLIDYCRDHPVDEILCLPDVQQRAELYFEHVEMAVEQIRRCSTVHDNVVVLDLRDEKTIYACNRFMIYALYPDCNCSIHALWGRGGQNTVYAIGQSIFNRTLAVNIGELCLRHDGGGHAGAGTVQANHADADRILQELIQVLSAGAEPVEVLAEADEVLAEADEVLAEADEVLAEADEEMPDLEDDSLDAEGILEGVMAENGMGLLPSKQDIREIHERLDRIERMIAEIAPALTAH